MVKITARGNLLYKQQVSNLVEHIISEIKEENKVIINDLSKDHDLVLNIVDKVEKYVNKQEHISKKIYNKLDKNEITIQIYIGLFPNLTEDEKEFVEKTLIFIINHKIMKVPKNFFLKFLYNVRKAVMSLF